MSTPSGLLRWGQAGRYSAFDDRVVITALAGGRTGVIRPARLAAAAGLKITVAGGWVAVGDCHDGTVAVLAGTVAVEADAAPGGDQARTDELIAEIVDPETARWALSVQPPGTRLGVVLGWVDVPAGAASAAEMTLTSREQDFSTGGAIPGPPGPMGPQGVEGPGGQATLIIGSFSRDPADLPADGFIEAGWDSPGNPANDLQIEVGWAVIHVPTGNLWTYLGHLFGAAWLNVGLVTGPPGAQGPQGPQGAQGPPGDPGIPPLDPWHDMRPGLLAGASYPGGGELVPQYRFNADRTMVYVVGTVNPPNPITAAFFIFPPEYRPTGIVGGPAASTLTTANQRMYCGTNGGLEIAGGWAGPARLSFMFASRGNPNIMPHVAADDWTPLPSTTPEEGTTNDRPKRPRPPRRTDKAGAAPDQARRHVQR
jgi:hypothetical protein